jgi:hypothetical protein
MDEKTIVRTRPIAIAIHKNKNEQYGLIHGRFDPPQNSPPSLWKMRLNNRIGCENPLKLSIQNRLNS